jgi:acetolactate synthase-1/2/3 large subunit
MCDTFAPAAEAGAGRVSVERIRSQGNQITTSLGGVEQLVLVGAELPVSLLAYPGKPSGFVFDGGAISVLAHPHEDAVQALTALADLLGAPAVSPGRTPLVLPELASGMLTPQVAAQAIAALTPEHAIYVDEGATATAALLPALARARPHLYLPLSGDSIGQGLPLAAGAAVAAPDRKVVCPIGDGGIAFAMQTLWSMAREKLDVTTVVFANRAYAILTTELQRVAAAGAGPKALPMFDLRRTDLNWARIGEGLGIESSRATTAEEFASQYRSAMSQRGPRLIEALVEQPMPAAARPGN